MAQPNQYQTACSITLIPMPIDQHALRQGVPILPDCGGYACFEGIVRSSSGSSFGHPSGPDGEELKVNFLDYSAYEPLALQEMESIAQEASMRYNLKYVQVTHRFGRIMVGETAVMIQVLSKHRAEAFAGCQMVIDQIKERVPIWKKEHYSQGVAQWVLCTHSKENHRGHHQKHP
jgi:molybdopterin synthase catalytic subunit